MREEKRLPVTFEEVRKSEEIKVYIERADQSLRAIGFTEHSFAHVMKCAVTASGLLQKLGYSERECDLVKIAGYMHDIGNVINRCDHAQSGAIMAFRILDKMGMPVEDIALVITAIGNHDEGTAFPVNAVAAALILADKTDVRRTRVRNSDLATFDIHDRVNFAVEESETIFDAEEKTFTLKLRIDTSICAVMDYFEIFLNRMLLCRKAAEFLGLVFKLEINGLVLL
ncbi:HD domain-containing protein [Massiliimalia massiliensis]|uniref:HD domain-containing protein n=1 Tax=Massiliimalia massiliensis TaxID=1852384 RepID=UPI000984D094|nr:HD domain-containing protein [Massiliimalia massiliensis]